MLEWIVVSIFGTMLVVGVVQVVNRYAVGAPLTWSEEVQRYLHVWLVFLSLPLGYLGRHHISLTLIKLKRKPKLRVFWDRAIDALWFVLGSLLAYNALQVMLVAKNQTSPSLQMPMSMMYSALLVSGVMLCLVSIFHMIQGSPLYIADEERTQ